MLIAWTKATAGTQEFSLSYDNDYYRPDDPDPLNRDRNLWLEYFEVIGPMDASMQTCALPEAHHRFCNIDRPPHLPPAQYWEKWSKPASTEVTRQILTRFATRAYRRPATDQEVKQLLGLVALAEQAGGGYQRGLQLAIQAVLVSPKFLFLGEFDPAPDDPRAVRPVSPYELASRVSYFLWSSLPDRELREHARKGSLRTNLHPQILRMLQDAKSRSLIENFGTQWLQLRDLENSMIDTK